MQRLDRILAVIDPTSDVQHGAMKAAILARAAHASLELFACDFDPALTGDPFFDTEALHSLREDFLDERAEQLEGLADELRTGGLDVVTHVHWDNPLHAGILRRIDEFAPDLVVKDTHHHSLLKRTLLSNTDWTLIRRCPAPLLLAKPRDWRAAPRMLAALDPLHHRGDTAAALDTDILEAAQLVARLVHGSVEAVHAFFPAALLATTSMAGIPIAADGTATDLLEAERRRATEAVRELAAMHGVEAAAVKVLQGSAAEVLPRHAEQSEADLLVMGAVSRGRVRELFVGSTAERVLDRLPCDVLVVKSADFRERLPF